MAAGDLELLVEPAAYQSKISQLEGYVTSLHVLKDQFNALGQEAGTVFGESDDALNQARKIVSDATQVVQQKIEATQASITTLQSVLDSMTSAGAAVDDALSNVGVMIETLIN